MKFYNFVPKKETWLPILFLITVGSFIYSFNLNNGLFWDDDDWIINNNFVHSISWSNVKFWLTHDVLAGVGLSSNYYRPFLFFTFALNYVISGTNSFSYHLFSNLIHIANAILIFFLLKRFNFGSLQRSNLVAFLTALIFTIHPLQTEAITYISGRGDALVAFFMLLALLLWSNDLEGHYSKMVNSFSIFTRLNLGQIQGLTLYYVLSVILLVLALLSRETAIIFPFLALTFYISFLSSSRSGFETVKGRTFLKSIKRGFIKTWPFFVVVLVYGILRLTVLNFQNTLNFYSEPNIYSENLYVRLFTFLPTLWEYLKLLIVPMGLHMERSAIVYTSLFQWPVWFVFLGFIGLLAWLRHLYQKRQQTNDYQQVTTKNIEYNVWLFGFMWFFIALGPVSGVTPINALIYEHWLYVPMIGFWLIISFYLIKLFDYLKSNKKTFGFWLLIIGLVVYTFFLADQSIKRNVLWGKQVEFYEDIIKYQPKSLKINNNLGNLYLTQGDIDKAEVYYRKAIDTGDVFSQPYYNLGRILQIRGNVSDAIQLYEKAIKIDPGFYYAYQNLVTIYAQQGNLIKAVENIEKLKKTLSQNSRVYYNSALIYIALNNRPQALEDLKTGLKYTQLDPETGKLIEELIKQLKN